MSCARRSTAVTQAHDLMTEPESPGSDWVTKLAWWVSFVAIMLLIAAPLILFCGYLAYLDHGKFDATLCWLGAGVVGFGFWLFVLAQLLYIRAALERR